MALFLSFLLLCLTTLSCFVRSDVLFLSPSANSTQVGGIEPGIGVDITIVESGIVPLLSDLLFSSQFLYAGANLDPIEIALLFQFKFSDVFSGNNSGILQEQIVLNSTITTNGINYFFVGSSSTLRGNPSVAVMNFSDWFTLTNMTGQMDPYLQNISIASAGQPGPARFFTCGPYVCDASVALAGLDLTSPSSTISTLTAAVSSTATQISASTTPTSKNTVASQPAKHISLAGPIAGSLGGLFLICCLSIFLGTRPSTGRKFQIIPTGAKRWKRKDKEHQPRLSELPSHGPYDTAELPASGERKSILGVFVLDLAAPVHQEADELRREVTSTVDEGRSMNGIAPEANNEENSDNINGAKMKGVLVERSNTL